LRRRHGRKTEPAFPSAGSHSFAVRRFMVAGRFQNLWQPPRAFQGVPDAVTRFPAANLHTNGNVRKDNVRTIDTPCWDQAMLRRKSMPLLLTFVIGLPVAAADKVTRETVVESKDSTRTADESKALFERLGWELAGTDGGVRIERISQNSAAAEAHLEEKDVIVKVGGENVASADRIAAILTELRKSGDTKTDVVILRDGEELSYLLSLDKLDQPARVQSSRTTVQSSEQDLFAMIQQLQLESQQQQALLQSLLTEVQSLRTQLGLPANARVNPAAPTGTQFTGDVVVPLGTGGVAPNNPTGVPANNTRGTAQPPAGGNRRQ
jgi:hypothetical protein